MHCVQKRSGDHQRKTRVAHRSLLVAARPAEGGPHEHPDTMTCCESWEERRALGRAPASVRLAPLPTQRPSDQRIGRPPLISERRIPGAEAAALPVGIQARTAHATKLPVAPAVRAIRITTATPRARGHRPVMIGAVVRTPSTIRHRIEGEADKVRPLAAVSASASPERATGTQSREEASADADLAARAMRPLTA